MTIHIGEIELVCDWPGCAASLRTRWYPGVAAAHGWKALDKYHFHRGLTCPHLCPAHSDKTEDDYYAAATEADAPTVIENNPAATPPCADTSSPA